MGKIRDTGSESGSDIVCLEGNGARPSHRGDGWTLDVTMTLCCERMDPHHMPCVILNPWDSQGNQITDSNGIYPTIRGCGGAGYQQGYVLQRGDDELPKSNDGIGINSTKCGED